MLKRIKRFSYFLLVLGMIFLVFMFLTNQGYKFRVFLAQTIMSTQHRDLADYLFLPKKEMEQILKNIDHPEYLNTLGEKTNPKEFPKRGDELTIEIKDIEKTYGTSYYYKGKMAIISNPYNLKLIPSQLSQYGEQIHVQAQRANALVAVNASGFIDKNGNGNGGEATGIVIVDGEIKSKNADEKDYGTGLTKNGKLVTGYYSANELVEHGVIYAAGFRPQLIVDGRKMITEDDGGWGIGPRTAIGQKRDGSIVMVVIDGRQTRSIGATLKEVQDIMYDEGVVNAMAMDGGSSSTMYYGGAVQTIPSSKNNIPRYLPNIWAVVLDDHQKVSVTVNGEKESW